MNCVAMKIILSIEVVAKYITAVDKSPIFATNMKIDQKFDYKEHTMLIPYNAIGDSSLLSLAMSQPF